MFDDPKKELRRLQDELLAAEAEEEWVDDDLEGIEELLEDYGEEAEESYEAYFEENYEDEYEEFRRPPVYRNYANGYGRRGAEPEEDDEDAALYTDVFTEKPAKPKEKGVRGLVILACLETLAILAVVGWWIAWLW